MIGELVAAVSVPNLEWELDDDGNRTGRWRRRQYYGQRGDTRIPSQRTPAEWRTGKP